MAIMATIVAMGETACDCAEYRLLQIRFSTGVTLREISSIAEIVSILARIPGPSREAKRNVAVMMRWFRSNWPLVSGWLPALQLRDKDDRVINGKREIGETKGIF
jgi:hypothetical protein